MISWPPTFRWCSPTWTSNARYESSSSTNNKWNNIPWLNTPCDFNVLLMLKSLTNLSIWLFTNARLGVDLRMFDITNSARNIVSFNEFFPSELTKSNLNFYFTWYIYHCSCYVISDVRVLCKQIQNAIINAAIYIIKYRSSIFDYLHIYLLIYNS